MSAPQRDVLERLIAYTGSGPRDERPEVLVPPGLQGWTRELAHAAKRPPAIAPGFCLADGSPLILTLPGAADIQRYRRVFAAARASVELDWIDQWTYRLTACPRARLRVTADERRAVDALASALGLSVAVAGALAWMAIMMQAPLVPRGTAEGWRDELRRFKRELQARVRRAGEFATLVEQRGPAAPNTVTWADVATTDDGGTA